MPICVGSSSVGHIIRCGKKSGLRKKLETHLKQLKEVDFFSYKVQFEVHLSDSFV